MGSTINPALSQPGWHRAIEQLSKRFEISNQAIEIRKASNGAAISPQTFWLRGGHRGGAKHSSQLFSTSSKNCISFRNYVKGFIAAFWNFQTINTSLDKFPHDFAGVKSMRANPWTRVFCFFSSISDMVLPNLPT